MVVPTHRAVGVGPACQPLMSPTKISRIGAWCLTLTDGFRINGINGPLQA